MAISKIGSNSVNLASGLDIADGDITVASGHGIDFSATANSGGSMANELLDDYEEGTFTPTLEYQNTSGLTLSYDEQVGHYTKIGRMVQLYIQLQADISGSLVNDNLSFTSLPFSISTGQQNTGSVVMVVSASGSGADKVYTLQADGTRLYFSNAQGNGNMADDVGTGTNVKLQVSLWYFVST